jgi:benzoate/toluate 1,2-dioxygenase alpha subunit
LSGSAPPPPAPSPGDLVHADRVHRLAYTDSALFDLEMERIFERGWVFVGAESEVPEPGDYKTATIGRVPVILSRDKEQGIVVLVNRCMHRGATVCREDYGNTSAFKCLYHGWTYKTSGDLIGVPFGGGYGKGWDKSAFSLRRAPHVGSYAGLVFASLTAVDVDLETHLGGARKYLDLMRDNSATGSLDVARVPERYVVEANWKLQLENVVDGYHPPFTHETAFEAIAREKGHNPATTSTQGSGARCATLGYGHGLLDYSDTDRGYSGKRSDSALAHHASLVERLGQERADEVSNADLQLLVFPNLFVQTGRQHLRVIRPVSVDRTEVYAHPYAVPGGPEDVNKAQLKAIAWWASVGGFGQPEDLEALAACQRGLAAPMAEWNYLGRGLHREVALSELETSGDVTDEVAQRGMYRRWIELMAEQS